MVPPVQFLSSSEAAARLGVSAKALRLYEKRGLVTPLRTAAGWRAYSPQDMERAAEIAALRHLGLSLSEVSRLLMEDPTGLEPALAIHQAALQQQARHLARTIENLSAVRADLDAGRDAGRAGEDRVGFDLPWPWGGERFVLPEIHALTYIIGPLGSGKTRLALALADAIPGAAFVGLDRLDDDGAEAGRQLADDAALAFRVDTLLTSLVRNGATRSAALLSLLVKLKTPGPSALVVDMVEQGLDGATQAALAAHLRQRRPKDRPLFLMTRSCAILDLATITQKEAILFCPANHSPPHRVAPYPGTPSYEAMATCLASPEVRARTEGTIAWRPGSGGHGIAARP